MSLRTIASFAVAILLGLIAVVIVRNFMISGAKRGAASEAGGTVPVVVAARPIEHGATLQPVMLKVVAYPSDGVPAGAFQSVAQLTSATHAALRPLTLNEPIVASEISGAGGKANLSAALTPGMRAVSVRSSDVTGVGGFVLPGDRVDVLVTRTIGSGDNAVTVTQALAENALVLGVDQSADQTADKPIVAKAVTVEVFPEQAQAISLAQSVGAITLALRQIADGAPLVRRATTVADLGMFGYRKPPPAGAAPGGPARAKSKPALGGGRGTHLVHVARGVEMSSYAVAAS